jgi:xylulokinase
MRDACLIGLDLGTTNAKALLCNAAGGILHVASRRMPVREMAGGRAEYDPEAVWETALAVVREAVLAAPHPRAIRAIAVTSVGEAGVPCGEDGDPVYPVIAWYDPRSAAQADALVARMGERTLYEITGLPGLPIHTVHKLAWLRDNEPEAFRRIRRWYFMSDYAVWRLSGAWVTDPSLACRSRMFDIRRRRWSPEILEAAGVPASILPPVQPSGSPAGRIHPDLARDLGVGMDVVATVGGHDHICASLASGVTRPGDILDSVGTAEALLAAVDTPPPSAVTAQAGFAVGCHVVPNGHYVLGGITMSGGAVEWVSRLTNMPLADLIDSASRVPPGSEGLCFLPHLRGSLSAVVDRFSMAAFLGLRDIHGPAHLGRAVLEGLACEAAVHADALEGIAGRAGVLRVTGGGTRNALWLAIKAAVHNRPLEILATVETAALGAALLGGVAAGVFADAGEAERAGIRIGRRVDPDPALVSAMAARVRIHRELYPAVAPIHHRLRDEAAGVHTREGH